MLQKRMKRAVSFVTALALVCTGAVGFWKADSVQAAKRAKLKTKKLTVKVGKKKKIVVKGKKKKAKYTFKSNKKKIATVSKKGVVKGIKKGTAYITVTEKAAKKRKLGKVKVTVKKAVTKKSTQKPTVTSNTGTDQKNTQKPTTNTDAPAVTPTPTTEASATPGSTETPAPSDQLTLTGDQLQPTTEDSRTDGFYTVNEDGSVSVTGGWKYYAISLGEKPLNLATVKSVEIEGSASAGYRLSFGNKAGEYFIDHENLDSWTYPAAFDGTASVDLTNLNPSGEADWLFLGTKGEDDVTFNIKSITFKLGKPAATNVNTDGLTEAMKEQGKNNPIAAQRFMADPYAIEYEGRVYVYGTNDSQSMRIGEDGKVPNNDYSNINTLNCYSSTDMVNWRDEGIIQVAGKKGPASWSKNSWAPAVAYKNIDGKDKFFIYFADNGSGIGVLEGDSPTGPWRDPVGKQLISRNTPNCGGSEVPWLFDPAVLVDDDGQGYLYFGGIGDAKDREHPNCLRVVKLGDDMVSLKEDPQVIDAPAPFEDSGINKIGDKYYFSYCTNWDANRPNTNHLGVAKIAYMVSDSPMGPWSDAKVVLDNPTSYFAGLPSNDKNNNHHCMLQRGDKLYMFYHSQKMAADMGITQGYRTTGVDLVTIDANGDLKSSMTEEGVEQVGTLNPYEVVEAETFAWSDGTSTIVGPEQKGNRNNRVLSSIDKNDYVGLDGVDFGTDNGGAKSVMIRVASASKEKVEGTVSVYIDSIASNKKVGEISISADEEYKYMKAKLTKSVTRKHKLFFRFDVGGILVDTWMFSHDEEPQEPVEEQEPAPDPVEGALVNLSGDALKPVEVNNGEFSVGVKGITVPGGWKFCAIDLGETVDLSKVASIKFNGSISAGYRMSFRGEDKDAWQFFVDEDKTGAENEWMSVEAQSDTVTDVAIEGKGNAHYLLLGTNSSEVVFDLKQISVMPKEATEG